MKDDQNLSEKQKRTIMKQGGIPKESITKFEKVFYDKDSDSSLVKCFPITGRTHQIRVHLQSIGHPIIGDVNYGGRFLGISYWFMLIYRQLFFKVY